MRKDTPSSIHNNAIELIRKYGYANVSVNQICEKSNITKGTFYYHFFSKEQLLTNLFFKEMTSVFKNKDLDTPRSTLQAINHNTELIFNKIEDMGYEIMSEILSIELRNGGVFDNPFAKDNFAANIRILTISLIKEAQVNGDISHCINVEDFYYCYHVGTLGILFDWCSKKGSYPLLPRIKKLFHNIFFTESISLNPIKV